jgi:hypothetical protein
MDNRRAMSCPQCGGRVTNVFDEDPLSRAEDDDARDDADDAAPDDDPDDDRAA